MSELRLNTDGHIIKLGADNDVSLTHVHDTGLLLNSTNVIQFNDASQNIGAPSATVLDINATDEIELNATLADVNANLDVSGTIVGASTISGTTLTVSGGQIVFPGTQAASTGANTLDDYEEGTWTPACSGSTEGAQHGFYTKIGRMCYISLSFSITAISSGNPSQISGLPFSQKNAAGHNGIITVGDARNQSTGTVDLRLRTDTNTALLVFVGKEADATDYDDDLNVMQNGFSVTASGWYCVE